jgi:hypothetical protein
MTTHGNFKWKIGRVYNTNGKGELCSPGWLHAYKSSLLAVLHNPIHANFVSYKLFKADTLDGYIKQDNQMKLGSNKMKLIEEIPIPEININQKIAYGILCAKEIYKDKKFNEWANNWLSGKDRSRKSAIRAARAAAAAYAASAAACVAARAADAVDAASADYAAARAACAAAYAAAYATDAYAADASAAAASAG